MVLIIIGGILAVLGIILLVIKKSREKRLFTIRAIPKRSLNELQQLAGEIAQEMGGPGSFSDVAKVYGTIESTNPLTSNLAGASSVWFHSRVIRKYEVDEIQKDSDGKEKHVTQTREETLHDITRDSEFFIREGESQALVNLNSCHFDTVTVVDEFQPDRNQETAIEYGPLKISIGTPEQNSRTLGFQYKEEIIPVGASALMVGQITDRDSSGQLKFEKPEDSNYHYLLALKSEDELVAETKSSIKGLHIGSLAVLIFGGVGLIVGILLKIFGILP
jgi:hypothetical protein